MPRIRFLFQVLGAVLFTSGLFLHSDLSRASSAKGGDFKEVGVDDNDTSSTKSGEDSSIDKMPVPKLKMDEEILTGTPTVIRNLNGTEVFFKDLNESYFIPSGAHHNEIYKAFSTNSESGGKVTFRVSKKSRRVLSLEDAPPAAPAPAPGSSPAPGTPIPMPEPTKAPGTL